MVVTMFNGILRMVDVFFFDILGDELVRTWKEKAVLVDVEVERSLVTFYEEPERSMLPTPTLLTS